MKLVINRCFGGFSLSEEACQHMGQEWDSFGFSHRDASKRSDPKLVAAVEELGEAANGRSADLVVVEIPDDVEWYIHDYDGKESIHEQHRSWA
jgi:hypothetical protein